MFRFLFLPLVAVSLTIPLLSFASDDAGDDTNVIHRFDLTYLYDLDRNDPAQAREAWDTMHLAASLQGIVNREAPALFLRFMADTDDFWFDHLRSPGEWLHGREVVETQSLEELLQVFRGKIRGLVLYSENVRATSNLASTIAGVEDRLALRYDPSPDSLYSRIMAMEPKWTDVRRLFRDDGTSRTTGEPGRPIEGTNPALPSTGSAKADSYMWAKQRYLDAGKTSEEFLAFYLDSFWLEHPTAAALENFTLSNHDFFIAHRAFFFDLGVWADEAPVDDPEQPLGADRQTLEAIFESMTRRANNGMIHIGGFTPWLWKYTSHAPGGSRHGGVATEWELNRLASQYNAVIDSDAIGYSGMANASFYQHHPLKERYAQPKRPTGDSLREAGFLDADGRVAPHVYVMFYQGDYDSAAWLNRFVPRWWADPARGTIPLNWPFNPNLDRRAPHAIHYARTRQTADEWFIAGDSGAGYLNPGNLFADNRPDGRTDGWNAWVEYCSYYYHKYDLTITGFIIDGASPGMGSEGMDRYMTFSPGGIIGQKMPLQGVHRDSMPFIRMQGNFHQISSSEAARRLADGIGDIRGPYFVPLRTILMSPSWHKETIQRVHELTREGQVRFVNAYTFMNLLRIFEQTKHDFPAPSGPFTGAREVRFSDGEGDGLWPVTVADGPFERVEIDGAPALRQAPSKNTRYLYFRAGDGFGRSTEWDVGMDLVLKVSILDSSEGEIGVHYNTPGNSYEGTEGTIALTGTGRWQEISFSLPNARFEHSQNGQASFRLVNLGADLIVREVRVGAAPPGT